jgi:hypothetical protein
MSNRNTSSGITAMCRSSDGADSLMLLVFDMKRVKFIYYVKIFFFSQFALAEK